MNTLYQYILAGDKTDKIGSILVFFPFERRALPVDNASPDDGDVVEIVTGKEALVNVVVRVRPESGYVARIVLQVFASQERCAHFETQGDVAP